MGAYIFRRLLMLLPLLVGITLVSFLILQTVPGDPARIIAGMDADEEMVQKVRHQLGLDRSISIQYLNFLAHVIRGAFGQSIRTGHPVVKEIWPRFLNSVRLAIARILIAFLFGATAGVLDST